MTNAASGGQIIALLNNEVPAGTFQATTAIAAGLANPTGLTLQDLNGTAGKELVYVNNAAAGSGINERVYREIRGFGADVITMGDHAYHRREAGRPLDIFAMALAADFGERGRGVDASYIDVVLDSNAASRGLRRLRETRRGQREDGPL